MALHVPCCCNFNFDFTVPVPVKIENNFFVPQLFAFVPCFFIRAQAVVYENTESKVSKYGVFLVRVFSYLGWIRKIRTRKNFIFGYFSYSEKFLHTSREANNTCFGKTLLIFLTMGIWDSISLKFLFSSLISQASEFILFSVSHDCLGTNQSTVTGFVPSAFVLCMLLPYVHKNVATR